MLEAKHIKAGYPGHTVLGDFSYEFEPGKLYILMGKNGSGKSTLLNTLGGWQKPLAGQAFVNGMDLQNLSAQKRAAYTGRIALDLTGLSMKVERFVLLGSYALRKWIEPYSKKDYDSVHAALKAMNIASLKDKRMDQISSGERQKAAIAQVMVQNPVCLFLDEPSSSLDPYARFELMERLAALKDSERILLVIVHDLDLALRYGDEILVLNEGQLAFSGTPDQLVESNVLASVFQLMLEDWDLQSRTGRIFPLAKSVNK